MTWFTLVPFDAATTKIKRVGQIHWKSSQLKSTRDPAVPLLQRLQAIAPEDWRSELETIQTHYTTFSSNHNPSPGPTALFESRTEAVQEHQTSTDV